MSEYVYGYKRELAKLADDRIVKIHETGVGAIDLTVTHTAKWLLREIRLSLNAVGGASAGDFTMTIDNAAGAVYDHLLLEQTMDAVRYVRWSNGAHLEIADAVVFEFPNTNAVTWGIEMLYEEA